MSFPFSLQYVFIKILFNNKHCNWKCIHALFATLQGTSPHLFLSKNFSSWEKWHWSRVEGIKGSEWRPQGKIMQCSTLRIGLIFYSQFGIYQKLASFTSDQDQSIKTFWGWAVNLLLSTLPRIRLSQFLSGMGSVLGHVEHTHVVLKEKNISDFKTD